jgi:hypothetical protein
MLMVPAAIVFVAMTLMRVRRNKFHRQRITKGHSKESLPKPVPKPFSPANIKEGGIGSVKSKTGKL